MADGGEGSQELTVESGVAGLSVGQLPGEEGEGGTKTVAHIAGELLQFVYLRCLLLGR